MSAKYKMTISRLTVDKLGVKLYDRVSAVIAEIVANSYDADATKVVVTAPMGQLLAAKSGGKLFDNGHIIEVTDNGVGMTPDEVNEFYLKVGAERREDPKRGDKSRQFGRKVMGRKGVGKLAPFGVCQEVEIITSGGDKIEGKDQNGKSSKGYLTAHLFLNRPKMLTDTDRAYNPPPGKLDGFVMPKRGTTVRLALFEHRRVPEISSFERQLSQRFGVPSSNWQIELVDSLKKDQSLGRSRVVGGFSVSKMPNTEIRFEEVLDGKNKSLRPPKYRVLGPDGSELSDLEAGFRSENTFYPLVGWVAYSKQPYKDDLMAGIRIYCRGKIAAQTHIFNMKAGFTGEYDIRSYLVGELHADWLDEDEDLIRTDRQDILWSHELGQALESWGRALVKRIGAMTREPRRAKAWQQFEEVSGIRTIVEKAFPSEHQEQIRTNTIDIAKAIARTTREDELQDAVQVESIVNLSLLLGPHITLDRKLLEAAESKDTPLEAITGILQTARIAELAGFGKIADDRIRVITKVESLKDTPGTLESAFQKLLTAAPWLINPQWAPITANQALSTLKQEFQKFYKKKMGVDLILDDFSNPDKQPDFVLSSQDNKIQIIEIKKPNHALRDDEMERINTYIELIDEFLDLDGNAEFKRTFPEFHVTLVCDKLALKGTAKSAFSGFKKDGTLTHMNWSAFLLSTRKAHEDFLNEAERQKANAAKQ